MLKLHPTQPHIQSLQGTDPEQRVAPLAVCRQLRGEDATATADAVACAAREAVDAGVFRSQRRSAAKTAEGATDLMTTGFCYSARNATSVPGL